MKERGGYILSNIQQRLTTLRNLDRNHQVFGSESHKYRSVPLSLKSVEDFERSIGVALPTGYRDFLLEIGVGCGPYYGIWSPGEVLREIRVLCEDDCEATHVSPSDPFPLKDVNQHIQKQDWPSGGCIPIGHQGCTFWSVLVLEGAFRGSVWDVACFEGIDGEWLPARRPSGVITLRTSRAMELPALRDPPEFLEWVESWIERCLVDLAA